MKKRLTALALAALLALSLTGCARSGGEEETEEPKPGTAVEVTAVERGDIYNESTVTGSVMANRDIPIMPPVSGRVKDVAVKAGDMVAEGDVLFTMDTADLRDTYGALIDSYTRTRTLLDEQVRQTQQSLDNLRALYEIGAVSRNNVEQTELALLQAQTSRETTLAQLGADDLMETLTDPAVRATISGTVSSVGVTAGVMAANTGVGVVVSEIGKPQAVVGVSEVLLPYVHVGDEVQVTLSSSDTPFTGTVDGVASALNGQTALYQVHIDLPEEVEAAIGMFAKVVFRTEARYDAVLAPTESIITDGLEQYVYVVEEGTAHRRTVTTGLTSGAMTEITTGLDEGETLVTVGQSYLADGAAVRIVEGGDQ